MVGDVIPPYPQYFLIGFRRFTKNYLCAEWGGLSPQSSPHGTAPGAARERRRQKGHH